MKPAKRLPITWTRIFVICRVAASKWDERWQYVGTHGSRLLNEEKERGDFWLWCCIDADTNLVFSHKVGKRDWWTGNTFVEDVRNRVKLPVQIATDNLRSYAFHIRQHFGYEGYSYGTETKVFGEPELLDGTLARLGRNEGVRRMQTAQRKAVIGSPDLESLTTSHIERAFLTVRQESKRFRAKQKPPRGEARRLICEIRLCHRPGCFTDC